MVIADGAGIKKQKSRATCRRAAFLNSRWEGETISSCGEMRQASRPVPAPAS